MSVWLNYGVIDIDDSTHQRIFKIKEFLNLLVIFNTKLILSYDFNYFKPRNITLSFVFFLLEFSY